MGPPKGFLLACVLSMVPNSPPMLFKASLTAGRVLRHNPCAGQRTLYKRPSGRQLLGIVYEAAEPG